MFTIFHEDFEKLALNLNRLVKNIDTDSVVDILDDNGVGLPEKLKDIVIGKVKDKISDQIMEIPEDPSLSIPYKQPKLKKHFMDRFKFKKIAFNIFPSTVRPILENIGIAHNEQYLLSKPMHHLITKKLETSSGMKEEEPKL